jgi:diaminopimelate epimerase
VKFAKYHGIGNDFIMVSDLEDEIELTAEVVRRLCDRHFGIGGDGVIRLVPGRAEADFFMDYSNADGSRGEMCGNGIRCLARFVVDEGLTRARAMKIDTRAGLKLVEFQGDGLIRVDMGAPSFRPAGIPMRWDGSDALHAKVDLPDEVVGVAALSMGNPHAVLFVDDPDEAPVTSLGPAIERSDSFPNGANVEFVVVPAPDRVRMRVWERGVGETLACGTGAAAAAVAARLLKSADPEMIVALPGGELEVEWRGGLDVSAPVYMTGPAEKSFEGEVEIA